THVLTILNQQQLRRLTSRVWDQTEFLSSYGIRSMSKAHEAEPFEFDGRIVRYEPAESVDRLKGGNSNWRGPIWFPTCFLLIESWRKLGTAFGGTPGVPAAWTGRETIPFVETSHMLADRLIKIFTRDADGRRPVFGDERKFQDDPHWRDQLLFYEYFH